MPVKKNFALFVVGMCWLVYTLLQTALVIGWIDESWSTFLSPLPGLLAVGALLWAGFSLGDCYLQIRKPSREGLLVLAIVFVFAVGVILPSGQWIGWDWRRALLYAPLSGASQELFFRSALLPAMLLFLKRKPKLAVLAHSVLFGLWHIGPLFMGTLLPVVLLIMFVPFLASLGWAWQVRHDGTVIWAMLQHSLIWFVLTPYSFGT